MSKPRILVQLDPDAHASVFDAVVAVDAGVDQLFQYSNVEPTQVEALVHGAMFTRGPKDLKSTAIFVGGTNVTRGEDLLSQITRCFFGPMRVSVMLDANGANTTAAAAVLAAARHVDLSSAKALVLAATGPVGQRAVRLLARQGASVKVASRSAERAEGVCSAIREAMPSADLTAVGTGDEKETAAALDSVDVLIAAGAAGICLVPKVVRTASSLKVAIDLNAVPPLGIEGVEVMDKAVEHDGTICYGAIGVGGNKMVIHREAIQRLFTDNSLVLDADEIYDIGQELE